MKCLEFSCQVSKQLICCKSAISFPNKKVHVVFFVPCFFVLWKHLVCSFRWCFINTVIIEEPQNHFNIKKQKNFNI